MILVILGTQDKEFPRLLEAIEKNIEEGKIFKMLLNYSHNLYLKEVDKDANLKQTLNYYKELLNSDNKQK